MGIPPIRFGLLYKDQALEGAVIKNVETGEYSRLKQSIKDGEPGEYGVTQTTDGEPGVNTHELRRESGYGIETKLRLRFPQNGKAPDHRFTASDSANNTHGLLDLLRFNLQRGMQQILLKIFPPDESDAG